MLVSRSVLVVAVVAASAAAQGYLGGTQYPPCNSSISQGSQYLGCFDFSQEIVQTQISGTNRTDYTFYPGWVATSDPTAAALYDNAVTPYNCTVACRGHGYKYAALYGGTSCRCMGNAPSTLAPLSSTGPNDPASQNSCHVALSGVPGNCPGDATQFCGYGNYADVYVDNSFPLLSSIDPNVEQYHYSYIGCFHPGFEPANAGVDQLRYRVPTTVSANFTTLNGCFQYCASLGFPFVEFYGGNLYSACDCGTEISHGYQQLDSQCKGDCMGGSTCAGGAGCCGQRRSNTIYFNPNLAGCYEAPIPSFTSTLGAPMQTYSEPVGGPTIVGHTATTASYAGNLVISTNPPSVPTGASGYSNLGCWARTSPSGAPIISGVSYGIAPGPVLGNVENCINACKGLRYTYASLIREATDPQGTLRCLCGNTFGANGGQKSAEFCHQLCPGNLPPLVYEYCGGYLQYEQIYGLTSTVSSSIAASTAHTSSSQIFTAPSSLPPSVSTGVSPTSPTTLVTESNTQITTSTLVMVTDTFMPPATTRATSESQTSTTDTGNGASPTTASTNGSLPSTTETLSGSISSSTDTTDNGALTLTPSGSTTQSSAPSSSPTAIPYIFSVELGFPNIYKRQTNQNFLSAAGTSESLGCSFAATFTIELGQLFTNGTQISTDDGILYQTFTPQDPVGIYVDIFSLTISNYLQWNNPAFDSGAGLAYFCQLPDGTILILFAGLSNPAYSPNCADVSLLAIPASYCQNNVLMYPTSTSTTTTTTTTTTSLASSTVTPQPTSPSLPILPANVFGNPQPGLVCGTVYYSRFEGSNTYEAMPTYAV